MLLRELLDFLICDSSLDSVFWESILILESVRVDCFIDYPHAALKAIKTGH